MALLKSCMPVLTHACCQCAQIDGGKLPWSVAFKPTEPILGPTRKAIPPVGGVDVSPIVWVALLSFFNEILLGPQGILNLLQRKIDLP